MYESLIQRPDHVFVIVLLALILGTMALSILGVAGMVMWRRHQATKMAHEMKMEMLASGMSADEIERILAAKTSAK